MQQFLNWSNKSMNHILWCNGGKILSQMSLQTEGNAEEQLFSWEGMKKEGNLESYTIIKHNMLDSA